MCSEPKAVWRMGHPALPGLATGTEDITASLINLNIFPGSCFIHGGIDKKKYAPLLSRASFGFEVLLNLYFQDTRMRVKATQGDSMFPSAISIRGSVCANTSGRSRVHQIPFNGFQISASPEHHKAKHLFQTPHRSYREFLTKVFKR